MNSKGIIGICLILAVTFFVKLSFSEEIVLVGGTVIDLSNFGKSFTDIENAVVVIKGEKIIEVGTRNSVRIPPNVRIIDTKSKYIIPGLIDGFGALDNQAFANAYLYMGITSVIGLFHGRRDPLFTKANPSPSVYPMRFIGHDGDAVKIPEMLTLIEKLAEEGIKFLLLMYELRPDQLKLAIEKAHELGMGTIGELGYTSYEEAITFGIDAFIHSSRYSLEMAPQDMKTKVAAQPFGPAARAYSDWLGGINSDAEFVLEYARILGSGSAALMPTLMLWCIDLPVLENPWKEPASNLLDPKDIHFPLDELSGRHNDEPQVMEESISKAENILRIEQKYFQAGAKYLAGSGTDVYGTMPGISLHQELELLTMIGLSERQAIAAATSNFSEIFKWQEVGNIKPGCRADILVIESNPLKDLKNIKKIDMVILKGKIIDREKLLETKYENHI